MLAIVGPIPISHHVPPVAVAETQPAVPVAGGSRTGAAPARAGRADDGRPAPEAAQRLPAQATVQGLPAADSSAPDTLYAPDPYALVGPTPAFEANVLEAERDLKAVLARLEMARAQAEQNRIEGRELLERAREVAAHDLARREAPAATGEDANRQAGPPAQPRSAPPDAPSGMAVAATPADSA